MELDTRHPFTVRQARTAGISPGMLRGPGYVQLFHGIYASALARPSLDLTARAALLAAPDGAVIAGATAAQLWGGLVPDDGQVTVRVGPGIRMRLSGIRARRGKAVPTIMRNGIRVTTPEQTFIDLGGVLGLVDLVVLGDSLVRQRVTTPAALVAAAEAYHGPHCGEVRRAAGYVRAGVDSGPETKVRMLMVLVGLPEPAVNIVIVRDGRVVRRYDMGYRKSQVAVEYDGRHHAESRQQWEHDIARREESDDEGWRLVIVTSSGLYDPAATLARIVAVCRSRGMAVAVTSGLWQRHFRLRP